MGSERAREAFEALYRTGAPWEIGRPQPAVEELARAGEIRGSVLDVGCGTGENALFLAALGHEVWGVDLAPSAVAEARRKATERGLAAVFLVADALDLGRLGRRFDTVLDSGLFHLFSDRDRARFVQSLAAVLGPGGVYHLLCFSDEEPDGWGPRRVSRDEIREAFAAGWTVRSIRPARYATRLSAEGARAWLATMVRTGGA